MGLTSLYIFKLFSPTSHHFFCFAVGLPTTPPLTPSLNFPLFYKHQCSPTCSSLPCFPRYIHLIKPCVLLSTSLCLSPSQSYGLLPSFYVFFFTFPPQCLFCCVCTCIALSFSLSITSILYVFVLISLVNYGFFIFGRAFWTTTTIAAIFITMMSTDYTALTASSSKSCSATRTRFAGVY